VVALLVALGLTLFGLGAADHALASSNATSWLWSSSKGEVARVNAETGKVDTRYKVIDAQGHVIQVSQTDHFLVLRDLTTGKVSSIDLATLQIAATTQTTAGLGVTVVLSGDAGFIIDQVQGLVRQMDPVSLAPIGDPLRFPPGVAGGNFDGDGTLWLVVPSQGTAVGVKPASLKPSGGAARPTATVTHTVAVADPGHDLSMSTLDSGVAVLDNTADTLSTVHGDQVHTLPISLSGNGSVPDRTTGGDTVPVTVVDDRHVYVVNGSAVHEFTVPGSGGQLAAAVPFAGRFYVADNATGTVYVLDQNGKLVNTITVPHAGGTLQLDVRGGHLFINAPNASTARVVDDKGRVQIVDKYANNIPGGDPPVSPPAPPPTPPKPPAGPPGAPGSVSATAGNASAHITWTAAPANGSPVTRYVVEGDGKTHAVASGQRTIDITGLTNGTRYTFTVYAVNAKGNGPKRAATPVVPTSDTPDAPASVTATAQKNGTVSLTWPAANGQGHAISRYDVTAVSTGAQSAVATSTTAGVTIPAGTLTYGTQYAFTVVAVNDKGANSVASPVSDTVVPFTAPAAPKSVAASTVDAPGSIAVSWQAGADNGRPITGYEVSTGTAKLTVTGTSVTLNGLGDGATVKVTVAAVNEAGAGPTGSATSRTIDKPTITAGAPAAARYNSFSVPFTVDGKGGATTCVITFVNGGSNSVPCTGTTVTGVWPGNTYNYSVTVTNKVGSASFSGGQSTPALFGTVVCTNNSYCGSGNSTGGIWIYPSPTQTSTSIGNAFAPAREQATCWTTDSKGATINAKPYGGKSDNRWIRIKYKGDNYIPYAWLTLDNSDQISTLPHC
jgi:hypothetical protein